MEAKPDSSLQEQKGTPSNFFGEFQVPNGSVHHSPNQKTNSHISSPPLELLQYH